MVAHYYQRDTVKTLCHISDSIYLVVVGSEEWLFAWNEQTNTELFSVHYYSVTNIKRILSTNSFIIKTHNEEGVYLLTIKDLATEKFSLHCLFDNKSSLSYEDLDIHVTYSSLIIAAPCAKLDFPYSCKLEYSILLMEVDLAGN